jgi:hypothetical protein
LADRLAIPAGELLPDNLHHLPLPRHDLQCLGDVLAQLGKPRRAAAGARARTGHDHPLARQMRRERLACRLLARKGAYRRRRAGRPLGRQLVLGAGRFQLLQLQLHLIDQPSPALAARPVKLAPHLLDRQAKMRDQSLRTRCLGTYARKLGIARYEQTLQRLDIIGGRITVAHQARWNHKTGLL